MAFNAAMILEVQQPGNDANGGGFNPANANFATDLTTNTNTGNTASPVVSSASYNFVAGDVGAWVYIKSGTNWTPGWFQIASVAANKATLSAAIGAAVLMQANQPLKANTVAGVATVGTPTSGTWGIDYSQQAAAKHALTDLVIDGTTNTDFTSAANPVGKNWVGNLINITSGTGFTVQRVEVVSVTGTTGRADKSMGTLSSTGGNGNLGGALATTGMAGGIKIAGNDVFIKYNASALPVTSASTNVTGGCVLDSTGGVDGTNMSRWVGYDTNRYLGNTDTKPLIQCSGAISSFTVFRNTGAYVGWWNLSVDCASKTTSTGIEVGANYSFGTRLKVVNSTVYGVVITGDRNYLNYCEASGCSGTAGIGVTTSHSQVQFCESHGNTTHGFRDAAYDTLFAFCLSYANTGATSDGFTSASVGDHYLGCVAYGNGRAGFDFTSSSVYPALVTNCIAEGNTGEGFRTDAVKQIAQLWNCAGYNNSSNYNSTNLTQVFGFVTGTSSFFTNPASGDFSLNTTAGGGAAARAAGFPGPFPAGTSTGYLDIGSVQHADPAGGAAGSGPVGNFFPGGNVHF